MDAVVVCVMPGGAKGSAACTFKAQLSVVTFFGLLDPENEGLQSFET